MFSGVSGNGDCVAVKEADWTAKTPQGLRVLLVEDHADSVASMATLLRMGGHEVRVAADGTAALEEALEVQPDVVLLDIGLPRPARQPGFAIDQADRPSTCL